MICHAISFRRFTYSCNKIIKTWIQISWKKIEITSSQILVNMVFDLETIEVSYITLWLLMFEKKSFQFWREIWIQVLIILLQLYHTMVI